MPRILLVYGTRYGQTRRIAVKVSQVLNTRGVAVDLYPADELPPFISLERYGAIVVAAPVYFGKHMKSIADFVHMNCAQLNTIPSAFMSISGSTGQEAQRYLTDLLASTGWSPLLAESFQGAIAYTRYNPVLRWIIRRISRKKGAPSDPSQDYDLTDWRRVEWFGLRAAQLIPQPSRLALVETGAGEIV